MSKWWWYVNTAFQPCMFKPVSYIATVCIPEAQPTKHTLQLVYYLQGWSPWEGTRIYTPSHTYTPGCMHACTCAHTLPTPHRGISCKPCHAMNCMFHSSPVPMWWSWSNWSSGIQESGLSTSLTISSLPVRPPQMAHWFSSPMKTGLSRGSIVLSMG